MRPAQVQPELAVGTSLQRITGQAQLLAPPVIEAKLQDHQLRQHQRAWLERDRMPTGVAVLNLPAARITAQRLPRQIATQHRTLAQQMQKQQEDGSALPEKGNTCQANGQNSQCTDQQVKRRQQPRGLPAALEGIKPGGHA